MKKVKMFLAAALFVGIGQVARAQSPQMTHDQLRIAVQQICPVSGQKLGAMGAPVKATIGQEEVFLCCEGCLTRKVNADHWATIHANLARAQGQCPVTNKPLPQNPKWTIVEGEIIYTCCPSCEEKIEANPKAYLEKVDSLYLASLKGGQASR